MKTAFRILCAVLMLGGAVLTITAPTPMHGLTGILLVLLGLALIFDKEK